MNITQLQIQDLCISFRNQIAVDNICFNVEQGRTVALVGESGSGKSVTGLAILGLLPSQARISGSVQFNDEELLKCSKKRTRQIRGKKIAMIFQEPMTSLNPVFTIGEQIEEVVRYHQRTSRKETRRKTLLLLNEVGINNDRLHAYPHEFSGGMRQRVMIAMALANEPSLLIADEPTTALDATTAKQILALLIHAKQRRGMSMIFITHDLNVVGSIADDICVLRSGILVESGDASSVLQNPRNGYTKALLACQPSITNRKSRLATVPLLLRENNK
jgi:ABC-type glutathione transport system ATPase component